MFRQRGALTVITPLLMLLVILLGVMALDGARLFRGGGHRDAAGGRLQSGSAFSMADAIAQVEPVLNPEKPAGSDSPFAALKNWKG